MFISTIIQDASRFGGGILNVAVSLHVFFRQVYPDAIFVSGNTVSQSGAECHVVGMRGQGFRQLPAAFMRDLVHIHGIWTPFEYRAFREARRRGARIVISPHGALEARAFSHKWAKKHLAWWLYQKRLLQAADLLVVNSLQEKQRLRELGLRPPISIIANGVDKEGLNSPALNTERKRIILFFSRIDPIKGLPDLLEAWSCLRDKKGYRLHIHGHGDADYISYIRRKIVNMRVNDIELLPGVFGPARWQVFTDASIYVLPSYSENFGITVAEALTAGMAVITTKATPWQMLPEEGLGWIVDNTVDELTSALQSAIDMTPVERAQLSRKAAAYADERFCWQRIAQQYRETYEWLLHPSLKAAPPWIDEF